MIGPSGTIEATSSAVMWRKYSSLYARKGAWFSSMRDSPGGIAHFFILSASSSIILRFFFPSGSSARAAWNA